MRILILDRFQARRDPAQMDMYGVLMEKYDVRVTSPEELYDSLLWADVLYLGIYHQVLQLQLFYPKLFAEIKCPVIIDQADNEDFLKRLPQMRYDLIKPRKVFLSRYLPNEGLQRAIPGVKQLSWYINPERVKYNGEEKDLDVSFVCSIYRQRTNYAAEISKICERNGWKAFVGQAWGDAYYEILKRSKVFLAECSRRCYTQKYTEAILCGCTIVGDRPEYPKNGIVMYEATFPTVEYWVKLALEMPFKGYPEFADKDRFLQEFKEIENIL